ncbi:type II secretion system minor pseudopilin GspJ [Sphingomonas sp. KR1UV-12]|uniref:Type II secretion system protein J n=1 Tax=Sphingomonas aurea TaxID=3063994 RepID=A0ABT9EGS1_9SPHN|nr:type II secretion system minor pseudopilin GspJ [Sphingomonas sp. KR1UV-12]MDP1025978.1 type II secretion system minor pseudopilin GspJ [Sphingomonas sp. KR1UV-12]
MRRSAEHGFTPLRRSAEHGFTLVEVMVALMIFGMIAAAGVAILSFSIRAQAASGARLDEGAALARTLSVLSADLAQAVARPTRDEGGILRPAFIGEPTSLLLVRGGWTNIDAAPRAGEQKVAWTVDGENLVRTGFPRLDGAAPLPPTPMLPGVRALVMRYRYGGAWSDRWDGASGVALPQAIEVRLVRSNGAQYRAMFLVGTGYAANAPAQTGNAT